MQSTVWLTFDNIVGILKLHCGIVSRLRFTKSGYCGYYSSKPVHHPVKVGIKAMDSLKPGTVSANDDHEDREIESPELQEQATAPGDDREIKWEVVTKTAGLTPAEIIAQRLQSEGIPARAWQEGAGQAFGLTVGLLGNGYVIVPEPYLEQAKAILAEPVEYDEMLPADEED